MDQVFEAFDRVGQRLGSQIELSIMFVSLVFFSFRLLMEVVRVKFHGKSMKYLLNLFGVDVRTRLQA